MSNNSTETDESVFIELIGVSPDDIPHDGAMSEHVELANEVDGLIKENHGFSTDGVSVCVNEKYHQALNEAYQTINHNDSNQSDNQFIEKHPDEIHDRIVELQKEPPEARLKELAEIVHAKVINKNLRDPDKIKKLCEEFGAREVAGTGLGMDITTVLTHLSEYTNLIESLQTPEHGGDRKSIEAISGNNINFQHNAYCALQSFYGSAIFPLVINEMEIFNTEMVLEDPISRDVYDHFYGHLSE